MSSGNACSLDMADFKQIRFSRGYRKFLPSDSRQLHQESLRWLDNTIQKYRGKKIVVVTHHAPSARSIDKKFVGNPLNPAFASRLDQFIEQREIAHWIHGHIHHCSDYQIGKTRVVANTRGYPERTPAASIRLLSSRSNPRALRRSILRNFKL